MRKIVLISVILSSFSFAQTMYIYNEKVDMLDPKTKEIIGTIFEGTEVKVIKKEQNNSLVEVRGEVIDGNNTALAYSKEGLVPYLELKNGEAQNKIEFLVANKDLTKTTLEAWDEAELNYYDTCSSCHAAHKPKEHLMSEWDAYISAMQSFAKISNAETARIVRFMQSHASDGYVKDE